MPENGNGSWKNIVLAALVSGVVCFWGGVGLAKFQSATVLEDHENRIRKVEEAVIYFRALVEAQNAK